MKLQIQVGSTSQSVNVFIQDSSSTTGQGLAGLVFNTSSLAAYYALPKAAAVSITLATLAAVTSAFSSGGFKEVEATNMKGWYRFDIPDAALASGRFVTIHLFGAANMAPLPIEIELTAVNNQSTGFGLVDVSSNIVKLLGTAWLTPGVAGTPDVNAKLWNGLTTVALPLVPTTAGRTLDVSAGGEAGIDWANVGSPTTANGLTGTTIATSQVVASVTGAVGSVTGAVGSVTGAVGSVTGAVGSVTGAVGSVTGNVGGNVTGSVGSVVGIRIKKNTALAAFPFLMVLSADHITPATGLTVAATRSIDGASFGACANAVVEVSAGVYVIDLAAADLNGNTVTLKFTAATADQRTIVIATEP